MDDPSSLPAIIGGMFAGSMFLFIIVFIALYFLLVIGIYIYMAMATQTIAKKTKTKDDWLAWIPIANMVLLINIAKKPMWWLILFFVPWANIVVLVIIWMEIAKACGKPDWWGVLMLVPIANFVVPGYLAWSK